jgi:hypothetical protein
MQTAWEIGEDFAQHWYLSYTIWLYAGEILGIFVAIGSITVASHPAFIIKYIDIKVIAFLVAIAASVNAFLDPLGRAKVFGDALAALDAQLNGMQVDIAMNADQKVVDDDVEKMKRAIADGTLAIRNQSVAARRQSAAIR